MRDVRARQVDVDVIEEVVPHVREVAGWMFRRDADVFIKVERPHVAEAVVLACTFTHDVLVHADRGAAGGKAEHTVRIRADCSEENAFFSRLNRM